MPGDKFRSHPVWVRGLKLAYVSENKQAKVVAPRVGAWIETTITKKDNTTAMSHPVWVRGLKLMSANKMTGLPPSHPVWVRGLKLFILTIIANFVRSHPVWVRGLKLIPVPFRILTPGRTPCGCVD